MTEEEIRPIAEQYVEEYCHCSDGEYTEGSLICAGIGTALIVARRLEKENAERSKEQLTQAKEIIQILIESLEILEGEEIRESKVVKEAEQFLKEV